MEAREKLFVDIGLGIMNTAALDWDIIVQHPQAVASFFFERGSMVLESSRASIDMTDCGGGNT